MQFAGDDRCQICSFIIIVVAYKLVFIVLALVTFIIVKYCSKSKHNFSLPPQKHSHMPT